jgi:DNA repair exonuclease SbcCD ATPase subunit
MQQIVVDSEEEFSEIEDCNSFAKNLNRGYSRSLKLDTHSAAKLLRKPPKNEMGYSIEPPSLRGHQDLNVEELQRELLSSEQRCESLQARLGDMQKQHKEIAGSLRQQLSKAQKHCKNLQRQVAILEDSTPFMSQGDDRSIMNTLNEKREEIRELREYLNDRERLRAFSTLSSTDLMPLDSRGVQADMASIGNLIEQIALQFDEDGIRITLSLRERRELKALVCRSFGLPLSISMDSADQTLDLSAFSFQAVMRSLMASALCEWVFEPVFQEISEQPCILLEEYRAHLAKQGTLSDANVTQSDC